MCMLVIAAGSQTSSAKRYTKISFWQHLREEIGSAVTESWLIFDQHCLDWQFDLSLVSSVFRWRFLSLTSCVSALSKDTNDLVRLSSLSTHILRERPKPNHLKQLVSTMSWDVFCFFARMHRQHLWNSWERWAGAALQHYTASTSKERLEAIFWVPFL